jgi:hypothetical protein
MHRFHSLTADLPTPLPFGKSTEQFEREMAVYREQINEVILTQHTETFLFTAVVCVAGAVVALFISSRAPIRSRAPAAS